MSKNCVNIFVKKLRLYSREKNVQKLQCPGVGRPFTYTETRNTKKRQTTTKHKQIIMSTLWPSVRTYRKQQGTQINQQQQQTSSHTIIISSFGPVVHVNKNTKETALHKITHQRLIISSCWPYARAYKRHKKHKEPHIINGTSKHN